MSAPEREYWMPVPIDDAWYEMIVKEYEPQLDPTDIDDQSEMREEYANGCVEYADVWDHVGDARDDWRKLADDWTRLRGLLDWMEADAKESGIFSIDVSVMIDAAREHFGLKKSED